MRPSQPPSIPVLRPLETGDAALVWEATELNLNWRERRYDRAAIAADPQLSRYAEVRAGRGDFGIVAELGGTVAGLVWLLVLPGEAPGHGFVEDGVPELGITVWPDRRRRGLGRTLLVAALEEARARGFERVSLSVEDGNPAVALYRSVGFGPAIDAAPGIFVLDLRARSHRPVSCPRDGTGTGTP